MTNANPFIRRADYLSLLDGLDLSGEGLYGLAYVVGWEPYDLHDLANASRIWSCTLLVRILHNIS